MEKIPQSRSKDAFQNASARLLNLLSTQRKTLFLIALPVALAVAIGYGWKFQKTRQETARRAALDEILSLISKVDQDTAKHRDEITKKADGLRKVGSEIHKDSIAKLELEAKNIKPNYDAVQPKLLAFYNLHNDENEGWNAGIVVAKQQLEAKKFEEAKNLTEGIAKASIRSKLYQMQSRFLLVGIYEELNQYDLAIQQEILLESLVSEDLVPAAKLAKARTLILKNSNDEAKATLQGIVEKHATSSEAQKARAYLTLLKINRG